MKQFLHILHGQFSGIHFLISLLGTNKDDFCFISSGTILQIFGPDYEKCPVHSILYSQMVDKTGSFFLNYN